MIWEGNMADSSGDFNRTNLMLPVHTTRTERERREMQRILATCAIEKRTRNGDSFVGIGSLVEGFFKNCDQKIHLITSEKVFPSRDFKLLLFMVQEAKWQKRKKEGGYLVYARNRSTDSMASHLYLLTELNLTFFENVIPVY